MPTDGQKIQGCTRLKQVKRQENRVDKYRILKKKKGKYVQ